MPLIYITGISGTGKSAIASELKRLGYEVYDADHDGFNAWHDAKTGEIIQPLHEDDIHTPEWWHKHVWHTSRKKIEELANKAKDKTIFLCGVSGNENEFWDLLSKVICLYIDEDTLHQRIKARTSNEFGKKPHEMDAILKSHKNYPENYRKFGVTIVDATQPLDKVVDEVIRLSK